MVEVRENLRTLFKADDSQLARLFSGRPVVIRCNLDEQAASRYQQSMERAGAIVQVRNASGSEGAVVPPDVDQEDDASEEGWVLAPLGADLLTRKERKQQPVANVDTSAISLAPVGSDVLVSGERTESADRDVDTSHLSLENAFKPE